MIKGLDAFVPLNAKVLILGSMPSVASLEATFYYAHAQNRFFKLLSAFLNQELTSIAERKASLARSHIALFDVIKSCSREGSLDSAIKDVVPNDLSSFVAQYPSIKMIVTNGALAKKLFLRFNKDLLGKSKLTILHNPSTSPANASFSLDKLKSFYFPVFQYALS